MKDELRRRISDAMDAPGGVEADAPLVALLEDDPQAAAYLTDLRRVDQALAFLTHEPRFDADEAAVERAFHGVDWEAMAGRIDAQLGVSAELDDIGDPTEAPVFEDDGASPSSDSETVDPGTIGSDSSRSDSFSSDSFSSDSFSSDGAEPMNDVQPVLVAPGVSSAAAPVVDLASRRRQRNVWIAGVAGLAAAAAVALGLTAGMSLEDDLAPAAEAGALMDSEAPPSPAPGSAAAPAAEAPEEGDRWVAARADLEEREQRANAQPGEALAGEALAQPSSAFAQELAASAEVPTRRARRAAAPRPSAPARPSAGRGGGDWPDPEPAPLPLRLGRGASSGREANVPDERAAQAALAGVASRVRGCMGTTREVARVRVQVASSGRIEQVEVGPPYGGDAARCMQAAVRSVRLPSASAGYRIGHTYRPLPIAGTGSSSRAGAARARRAAPAMMADDFE